MFSTLVKYKAYNKRQLEFDMDVIKYIIEANLSFKHVENEGFRHFIFKQNSRVVVKSATTFSRGKLPILYDSVKKFETVT